MDFAVHNVKRRSIYCAAHCRTDCNSCVGSNNRSSEAVAYVHRGCFGIAADKVKHYTGAGIYVPIANSMVGIKCVVICFVFVKIYIDKQ